MTLSGTRGLIRVSGNLTCEVQAAMAAEREREPDFYRRVTGDEYPGEYGERVAARRRGAKFEAELTRNNAAPLRKALAESFGWEADDMVVRNFADEVPGPPGQLHAMRLYRMRRLFDDLAAGLEIPHLLIQPQLRLPVGPEMQDFEHVSPDFMVLDRGRQMYVPGEMKSFIVRGNVGDPGDLDLTRRQAGAQILALQNEATRVGLEARVGHTAVFVFATPYGLSPAVPVEEVLDAEVHEVRRALDAIKAVRERLAALRAETDAPLEMLLDDLDVHFQESCISSCIMATVCADRFVGLTGRVGDAATELLGPDMDLGRVVELAAGATPTGPVEEHLASRLRDAAEVLGHDLGPLVGTGTGP